jgi:hypothetical protein
MASLPAAASQPVIRLGSGQAFDTEGPPHLLLDTFPLDPTFELDKM